MNLQNPAIKALGYDYMYPEETCSIHVLKMFVLSLFFFFAPFVSRGRKEGAARSKKEAVH